MKFGIEFEKKEDEPESNTENSTKKKDTHSYKGWMNSDRFWKRAWGVWSHNIAVNMIFIVFYLISLWILYMLA